MKLIDKRAIPLNVTFGDLPIGDAFQDECHNLAIKTDLSAAMVWDERQEFWRPNHSYEGDELIIPLEITYVAERKNK